MKAILLLLSVSALAAPRPASDVAGAVVKIYTTQQRQDWYQPWQSSPQSSLTGSGVVIPGGRIVTNAHVVSDATYVQVRKQGDSRRWDAEIEFVAHDSELAMLRVKDEEFLRGIAPVALGELPKQRDRIATYGYPNGGDELSITEGTISRIEVISYTHSLRNFLGLQTDAAINPGNSGGPMIKDGRIVGIAFQTLDNSQNISYAVPAPMVRRFLVDIADGRYDGVPTAGFRWQNLESPTLRGYYKVPAGKTGVVVQDVYADSGAKGLLQKGDVITAVDGTSIDHDGSYAFEKDKRLLFTHLLARRQAGHRLPFDVLRDGRPLRVEVPLKPSVEDMVAGPLYDVRPSYFIHGGLVFMPVTKNYLELWKPEDVASTFRYMRDYLHPSDERLEAVVLAYVLPHEVNAGYHELLGVIVHEVNGRRIRRLRDVVEAFERPVDGFQVVSFDPASDGGKLALDAAKAAAATPEILAARRIPSDRSDDLKEPEKQEAPAALSGRGPASRKP